MKREPRGCPHGQEIHVTLCFTLGGFSVLQVFSAGVDGCE